MKIIILAGGVGSRMGHLAQDLPKPMVALAGKPIMEYQIELAERYGFKEIYVLTGYKAAALEEYFGNGSSWGVSIKYHREKKPLGTAGAVKELEGILDEDFAVFYGDVLMDVDLPGLVNFHETRGPVATIAVHPNDHPFDSDLVEVDGHDRVLEIHNKPHDQGAYRRNLVSAALYVLSPAIFPHIQRGEISDFGRDIFPGLLSSGKFVSAYRTRDYIKDVGTPERLKEVEADLLTGRPQQLNQQSKTGAVFLDRDGVLNRPVEPLGTPGQLELFSGVASAVKRVNQSSRLSVMVTNQPLVAKGFASEDDLEKIHGRLETLLSERGAYLDRTYYCPHHPEKGHKGERSDLKIKCDCRKPATGMIDQAVFDLNIDLQDSFIIGDRTVDIQAGINAGVGTILVRTGCAGEDQLFRCIPDFIFDDLGEAVDFLEAGYPSLLSEVNKLVTADVLENRVIAIGGLSRSGKTTLAGVLTVVLRKAGVQAKRMSLDNWLFGLSQREVNNGVRDRYQYAQIRNALKKVLKGEAIEFSLYDSITRESTDIKDSLILKRDEFLIIDGVVSLDIKEIRDAASLLLYTETTESVRRERIRGLYEKKGLLNKEIELLHETRLGDEQPVVLRSRRFANSVINSGVLA
jgi:D,D-heptose 1,7-bisphosphate phosphatase